MAKRNWRQVKAKIKAVMLTTGGIKEAQQLYRELKTGGNDKVVNAKMRQISNWLH